MILVVNYCNVYGTESDHVAVHAIYVSAVTYATWRDQDHDDVSSRISTHVEEEVLLESIPFQMILSSTLEILLRSFQLEISVGVDGRSALLLLHSRVQMSAAGLLIPVQKHSGNPVEEPAID